MPSAQTQPPGRSRSMLISLMLIGLGVIGFAGYELAHHLRGERVSAVAPTNNPAASAPAKVPVASLTPAPKPATPGTVISAEEVLAKVDKWMAEHPNYHLSAVSAFPSGSIMGKMDVFAYSNAVAGKITSIRTQMFMPQAIEFIGVKKDGKFKVYFPATDQLVEQDLNQAMAAVPALAGASGFKALLKIAKNSYAEASADLEVATLVLNSQSLKLGQLPSTDIYLSVRANNQGQLLGLDQQTGGGRIMTTMHYMSFDPAAIASEAPALPIGKDVATNKTVQQAMQDEFRLVSRKPLGKKI